MLRLPTYFILISLLFKTLFANELPTISLSGGYGLYPAEKPSRLLETPLQYLFMHPTAAVHVDMGELYYEKNDIAEIERNRTFMKITISSNETGFIGDYDDFGILNSFNCDPSYCSLEDSATVKYRSTWIRGETNKIFLDFPISVAHGAWQLHTSALYIDEPSLRSALGGSLGLGWIGLGIDGEARNNFQTENPIFSILYDKTSNTGNLIFGFNSSLVDYSKPAITVTTTPNWEMHLVSVSVGEQPVYFVNDSQVQVLVLDLMTEDFIVFKDLAFSIISGLGQQGLKCFEIEFSCISQTLQGLPPIVFTFSDNTQISLSPDVYMGSFIDEAGLINYYTKRFTPRRLVEAYKDPVVLGKDVLAHFYSVFQQINQVNTITLYSLAPNTTIAEEQETPYPEPMQPQISIHEPSDAPTSSARFIFIVCICIAIVLGFICYMFLRQKERQPATKQSSDVELKKSEDDGIPLALDFSVSKTSNSHVG